MSSEKPFEFTKENIDLYLNAVAKEYRKRVGKGMPAELILIGSASVLINYGFRNTTTDVDAVIEAASSMKDAINAVGDRMGLPNVLANADISLISLEFFSWSALNSKKKFSSPPPSKKLQTSSAQR